MLLILFLWKKLTFSFVTVYQKPVFLGVFFFMQNYVLPYLLALTVVAFIYVMQSAPCVVLILHGMN